MIKQELLSSLLEDVDEKESGLNKQFDSPKIQTSFKKGKQEDDWNGGQAGRIT